MVLLAEADRFGQSGKSKCLQELLKEPGTSVGLLKFAKVWQILIYDAKFLSKSPVCTSNFLLCGWSSLLRESRQIVIYYL